METKHNESINGNAQIIPKVLDNKPNPPEFGPVAFSSRYVGPKTIPYGAYTTLTYNSTDVAHVTFVPNLGEFTAQFAGDYEFTVCNTWIIKDNNGGVIQVFVNFIVNGAFFYGRNETAIWFAELTSTTPQLYCSQSCSLLVSLNAGDIVKAVVNFDTVSAPIPPIPPLLLFSTLCGHMVQEPLSVLRTFSTTRTINTTILSASYNMLWPVAFNNVTFDTTGTISNGTFQIPSGASGIYEFDASLSFEILGMIRLDVPHIIVSAFYKNGVYMGCQAVDSHRNSSNFGSPVNPPTLVTQKLSAKLNCVAGEFISVYINIVYTGTNTGSSVKIHEGYFTGRMLSASTEIVDPIDELAIALPRQISVDEIVKIGSSNISLPNFPSNIREETLKSLRNVQGSIILNNNNNYYENGNINQKTSHMFKECEGQTSAVDVIKSMAHDKGDCGSNDYGRCYIDRRLCHNLPNQDITLSAKKKMNPKIFQYMAASAFSITAIFILPSSTTLRAGTPIISNGSYNNASGILTTPFSGVFQFNYDVSWTAHFFSPLYSVQFIFEIRVYVNDRPTWYSAKSGWNYQSTLIPTFDMWQSQSISAKFALDAGDTVRLVGFWMGSPSAAAGISECTFSCHTIG